MNKKEIYYKFIFPKYSKLSSSPNGENFIPSCDTGDQCGIVKALCRECPDRVITYDQLQGDSPTNSNYWTPQRRAILKSYIDQYISIPKYFDLRNYIDLSITQPGGISLLVSHSPEVHNVDLHSRTKFKSADNKIIYCSLIVSSGDFFYHWNLPDEVLNKSNLRDNIVSSKFHKNWYLTESEKHEYAHLSAVLGKYRNPSENSEKIIFDKSEFLYGEALDIGKKWDDLYDNTTEVPGQDGFIDTIVNLHTDQNDPVYTDPTNREYKAVYGDTTPSPTDPNITLGQIAIQNAVNTDTRCLNYQNRYHNDYADQDVTGLSYGSYAGGSRPSKYEQIREDLKKDFIDLEVTRRILHYGEYDYSTTSLEDFDDPNNPGTIIHNTIPRIVSGFGLNTVFSFEPPYEYTVRPPLQIPYNLLRYALNDRSPFCDCETLLVIWVADSDPMSESINPGDVQALHNLNWQQYAVPISVRCCFKDISDDNIYCNKRFLVSYPYKDLSNTPSNTITYRRHFRHCELYDKNIFREALYIQDLIEYSKDYILSYQHIDYKNNGFNIQQYLFKNCFNSFKEFYVRKIYRNATNPDDGRTIPALSNNHEQQVYYVKVDKEKYHYGKNKNNDICLVTDSDTSNIIFDPNVHMLRADFDKWDFDGLNDWFLDKWYITLFDIDKSLISEQTGKLELVNALNLKSYLKSISSTYEWNDIYISSLGISPVHWTTADSFLDDTVTGVALPLGVLDNYIKINDIHYGSTTNNKIVVGLKNVYDYKFEDLYHFVYNSSTNKYEMSTSNIECTVYIMTYINI